MIAYHGTNKRFDQFDFDRAGENTGDICQTSFFGVFFTESIDYAKNYAKYAAYNGGKEIILEAEIKVNNPLEITEEDLAELKNPAEYKETILAEGYDGLNIYTNLGFVEHCCFFPEQIRIKRKEKKDGR